MDISPKDHVDGLARGLAVIEAFDAETPELTLSEVARKTKLSPAAARRSLLTLKALGYLRSAGRSYVLAPKILSLGASYLRSTHVDDSFLPELIRLVALFGDAASVATLVGDEILYLAHHSERGGVRATAGVGTVFPAYPTSMGRVLLSGLTDGMLDAYFKATPLNKLTEATETDPDILRARVIETREQGYATVVDQLFYGVISLATPVYLGGVIVAAINSSGYTGRSTPEQLVVERLGELKVAAERIGDMLLRYPALRHSLGGTDDKRLRLMRA